MWRRKPRAEAVKPWCEEFTDLKKTGVFSYLSVWRESTVEITVGIFGAQLGFLEGA